MQLHSLVSQVLTHKSHPGVPEQYQYATNSSSHNSRNSSNYDYMKERTHILKRPPLICKTLVSDLVIWVVVPAVPDIPEPGFSPQALEPVDQDQGVEKPPYILVHLHFVVLNSH